MDLLIQLCGSLLLFLNKILLLKKKIKLGWIIGIIGILILSITVYQNKFWVALVSHTGYLSLMLYGYFLDTEIGKILKPFWKIVIRSVFILTTMGFCIYFFIQTFGMKNFNEWQLTHAITGLLGSLFLAFNTRKSNLAGWSFYILSHLVCSYYMSAKGLYIVAIFQIASAGIAVYAIKKELNNEHQTTTVPE